MAIDVKATFDELKIEVDKFVKDSESWRKQIQDDIKAGQKVSLDDQDMVKELDLAEQELTRSIGGPPPVTDIDMRKSFTKVNRPLRKAEFSYSYLTDISMSSSAKEKERQAWASLKKLIESIEKIRSRLLKPPSDNLFLTKMSNLEGKGPIEIGNTTFPGVKEAELELTKRLFKRERFRLADEKIIGNLIGSWKTVIAQFVDENKVDISDPKKIDASRADVEARFFTMHSLVELLYDQLETNRQTTDILSPSI